jgi:subtilisin-like proprotein convertase family protein
MLEVNPGLGYRDVQQILAYTARRTEIDVGIWDINGATNWNGGGLHYNALEHATGFGQVDALAAVRLAESWNLPALTAANVREASVRKVVNLPIPDNQSVGGVSSSVAVTEAMTVERVDVSVNIRHPFIGDLSVLLTSPSGTTSFLLWRPAKGALSAYGSSQDDVRFTFDTVLDWGESSLGTWTLSVYDNAAGLTGTFENWTLTLVGQPSMADDVYVYTNEYPDLVAADPSRAILRDVDGGANTLNTAALGLDNRIDLKAGRAILNGTELTIAAGTRITTAIGGDGDDTLTASDLGVTLRGMRGDDVLVGGAGNDRLEGGLGRDTLTGGAGIDTAVYEVRRAGVTLTRSTALDPTYMVRLSADDQDTLLSVERIRFADLSLALDLGGNAGITARMIGALFGPGRLGDEAFVGRWLARVDEGLDARGAIASALASPDFLSLAGSRSNTAFVNLVYKNVVGYAPDAAALSLFVGMLDRGEHTQVTLAELACNLDLTAARIDLTGLAATGLEYLPG